MSDDALYVNIPAANRSELMVGNLPVKVEITGNYPYDGNISIKLQSAGEFTLNLRIPSWCRSYSVKVNGEKVETVSLHRCWQSGDCVELSLDMPVEVIRANPKITGNLGRVALTLLKRSTRNIR